MSTQQQQFETFWAILEESEMDYGDHKEELKKAFLKTLPKVEPNQRQKTKVRKTHKKSGYNLYMSDCMKEKKMKMQEVPSWKLLAENEKKKWNDKATEENMKK